MPKIQFAKNFNPIIVPENSNLMKELLAANIPVASSCHGDGVCCKCKITIIEGLENLSLENSTEKYLKERNSLANHQRVSCQTTVLGDITIDTGYW